MFLATAVEYLGFKVDAEGLHPLLEKVRAIVEAPAPRNVGELKSLLGLLSYYSRLLQFCHIGILNRVQMGLWSVCKMKW